MGCTSSKRKSPLGSKQNDREHLQQTVVGEYLLDYLVSSIEQRSWDAQAECLRCLQVIANSNVLDFWNGS
jgi:hypothetical protein